VAGNIVNEDNDIAAYSRDGLERALRGELEHRLLAASTVIGFARAGA